MSPPDHLLAVPIVLPAMIAPATMLSMRRHRNLALALSLGGAIAMLVAAVALLTGRPWADRLATATATVSTSIAVVAFVLVALGHDPFSARST
ncbi:hypothetical protein NL533_30690, partial [Klebsiella pneumoniae]|nr:hypothetical protein [Klebsiella pneumoniae]